MSSTPEGIETENIPATRRLMGAPEDSPAAGTLDAMRAVAVAVAAANCVRRRARRGDRLETLAIDLELASVVTGVVFVGSSWGK